MAIINSVLSWLIKKRMHQIDLFIRYPHDVQREWLSRLLSTAATTQWGIKYDFKTIRSAEIYRERVPVSTYEELKPMIDLLRQGKQNILWPEEIKWFAKSSGTTADKSKFIPVTEDALNDVIFVAEKISWQYICLNFRNPKFWTARVFPLVGRTR